MSINIESLGFTKEELFDRVVSKVTETLLAEYCTDEEGGEHARRSAFQNKLQAAVLKRVDEAIIALGKKHVLPNAVKMLEGIVLQKTNAWGEKEGPEQTFVEYLISRADAYMRENVDYEGKPLTTDGSRYGSSKAQTRVVHLIDKHLHFRIETAMKSAMAAANASLVKGLEETVKIKLGEIAEKLKMEVKTS